MIDPSQATGVRAPWKILIADDDRDVHEATRMALRGISFRERALEFIDAYSGAETIAALQANPDTAIVFLDVIMETEDAGLVTARRIRESGFKLVRIIIRTGFPGQAPERKVVVDYDIHDYKEKTGLSVQKLFTAVISALRAYDDLVALEHHRRGLMSVLESVSWFDFTTIQRYISGMLAEFSDLALIGAASIVMVSRPCASPEDEPTVLAAQGEWPCASEPMRMEDLPAEVSALVKDSLKMRRGLAASHGRTMYLRNHGMDLVVLAVGRDAFAQADEVLLEVFLGKVCQAVSNHRTFGDMEGDRAILLRGIALRAEAWNDNATVELDRLVRLTSAIAERVETTLAFPGETDRSAMRDIGVAAMLHDLGNESIPAALLLRDTAYQAEDRKLMQTHVARGIVALESLLEGAPKSGILKLARDITAFHHERFDGSGYPEGLCGDAIPLAARLVAVADAYVAMTSDRPHRPALEAAAARTAIKAGASLDYDPRIVAAFLEIIDSGFAN